MGRNVLLILVGHRHEAAVQVQKTLTNRGCIIKTRLGLHSGVLTECSEKGLIFCELVGDENEQKELLNELNLIKEVKAQLVSLKLDEEA
ncbi:MAG: hypothetical protein A2020_09340 [Lentisphaerae bacterium GWF2_45_14]|nr:MAG: hypothetical protein A2020_09340 [Lentisphaerae bacterium GWF2_45_14]